MLKIILKYIIYINILKLHDIDYIINLIYYLLLKNLKKRFL